MNKQVRPIRYEDDLNPVYKCPVCGIGEVLVDKPKFYGYCDTCSATLIDYVPNSYQKTFHESIAKFRLNLGGYGTGKTTSSIVEIVMHALSTPNGRTLITANTLQQVKQAVLPELMNILPDKQIKKQKKEPPYFLLKNGHEIICYPSTDEQKIRSLNLTAFYMEEASGIDYKIFTQLVARLRNPAGIVYKNGRRVATKFMGIVCTNPEDGWIVDKFLLLCGQIFASPSIDPAIYKNLKKTETFEQYEAFLSSSRDNEYLDEDFLPDLMAGKSKEWIRKYVDCYMDLKEGAVFKDFAKHLVEPFEIPSHWIRFGGFDAG